MTKDAYSAARTGTLDSASGTPGDDIFVSTGEDESFVGGAGNDTVQFGGLASGYRIDWIGGRARIVDIDSSDGDTGADWVSQVETLSFTDRTFGLDIALTAGVQVSSIGTSLYAWDQPDLTLLADGRYVITMNGFDGTAEHRYAQFYDANGKPVGDLSLVADSPNESYRQTYDAVSSNGNYAVASETDTGIAVRCFNQEGVLLTDTRVSGEFDGNEDEDVHFVALADGGFALIWNNDEQMYSRRFDESGVAVGGRITVANHGASLYGYQDVDLVALANGGYVASWIKGGSDGGEGVFVRHYDSAGNPISTVKRIDGSTQLINDQTTIALTDGGYVSIWQTYDINYEHHVFQGQRYNAAGDKVGGRFTPFQFDDENNEIGGIGATVNGGFVVTAWDYSDNNTYELVLRHYRPDGTSVRASVATQTVDNFGQILDPVVVALENGGFVVTWSSETDIDNVYNMNTQAFNAAGAKVGGITSFAVFQDSYSGYFSDTPDVVYHDDGGYTLKWFSDTVGDSYYTSIYSQRYDAKGLPAQELLQITGTSQADTINAGSGAQRLLGQGGGDSLSGGGGNDLLIGGNGNDKLSGGADNDFFVFNTALNAGSNVDTIRDFNVVADTIRLENAIFTQLVVTGNLAAANFRASTSGNAVDADDYILYNTDTGELFYDADGNGAGAKVQFALVGTSTHPVLTAADFQVI